MKNKSRLLFISLWMTFTFLSLSPQLHAQLAELIRLEVPTVPLVNCVNLTRLNDPYCLNRLNCLRDGDKPFRITYPTTAVAIEQGNTIKVTWTKHPSPYLDGYIIEALGAAADLSNPVLLKCTTVGGDKLSAEFAFCNTGVFATVIIRITPFANHWAYAGGQLDNGKYYLGERICSVVLAPKAIPFGTTGFDQICQSTHTVEAPAYPISGENYNVRWYESFIDGADDFAHEGKTWSRSFSDGATQLFYSYTVEAGPACPGFSLTGAKSPYTVVKLPAQVIAPPLPQTVVLCHSGQYTISVPPPPVGQNFNVNWYASPLDQEPFYTGNSWTQQYYASQNTYNYWVTYSLPDLCGNGIDESPKSPIAVGLVSFPLDIAPIATPSVSYFTQKTGNYELKYKPAIPGLITRWYKNLTDLTPLHTGNTFNTPLRSGINNFYIAYTSDQCDVVENPIRALYTAVVGKITLPLPVSFNRTGTLEEADLPSMRIAEKNIYVQIPQSFNTKLQVKVYDLLSREIISKDLSNETSAEISLSTLLPGMYLVALSKTNGEQIKVEKYLQQ